VARARAGSEREIGVRSVDEAVILVTGSTDGLGEPTARDLDAARATVLLHSRDPGRGDAAVREIREDTGNDRLH
jgi:NAD(P)-dependent dehydrogenase (short-subunit alcohol dehydrogenase family)